MMRLLESIEGHARREPGRVAYREVVSGEGRVMTYGELWERVRGFAGEVRERVGEGATVVVRVPNRCEYPVAFLGVLAAGCGVFPVPAEITEAELEGAVRRAGVAGVVTAKHEGERSTQSQAPNPKQCPKLQLSTLEQEGEGRRHGLLLQSSGTTGRPKIVYRPAGAVDAVSANMVRAVGVGVGDVVLATVPLCHSYGLEHGLLMPLMAGATVHLCHGFDLHLVLRELKEGGVTVFPAVPSMYEMLGQLGDEGVRCPGLRLAYSAGGPLPRGVAGAFERKFGVRIGQLYGASEIGSVTFGRPGEEGFDPASVGRAMEGVEVRIVAKEGGDKSEEGEVWVRATSMFAGYVDDDAPCTVDGFFRTGDMGRLDRHGNLTITGRIKLLIDVGGLKVNPLEVEDVMRGHPAVADCVVVPVRMSETISRLKAVVVARAGTSVTAEELRRFARERLTAHKVPRVFEVRGELPRSGTGKVLRHLVE